MKRVNYMHWLLATGKSGNCEEFADKMGLSRRQLLDNLRDFKQMGAPIKYSKTEKKYYYGYNWVPFTDIHVNN